MGIGTIVLGTIIMLVTLGSGFVKFYLGSDEVRELKNQKSVLEIMKLMNQVQVYNCDRIHSINQLQLKQAACTAAVRKIAAGNSAVLKDLTEVHKNEMTNQALLLKNQLQYLEATDKVFKALQIILPGNIKTMGKIEKSLRPLENSLGVIAQWKDSKFVPDKIGRSFHETYCSVADIRKSFADSEMMLNNISQISCKKLSPVTKAYIKTLTKGIKVNASNMAVLQRNAISVPTKETKTAVEELIRNSSAATKQFVDSHCRKDGVLSVQIKENLAKINARIAQVESNTKVVLILLINESLLGILCGIGFLMAGIWFCSHKD